MFEVTTEDYVLKFTLTCIAAALTVSQPALANSEDIEKITVEGQYLSINKSNSVKTPTPIIDVPQSLSIMTAEEITQRGITSIGAIVDYTPGINNSQGEGHRDAVVFRGVRSTADFYIDGNRDDVQYYRALYNVEQVEVLRGPNALLFGRGGTGGIINRVSKKAQLDTQFVGFNTSVDSFAGVNGQVDINTMTSQNSALRVNAMYQQIEGDRDFYDGERLGVNPTMHFELNDTTLLDLSYEYINHERFIDRGIPTAANGRPVVALNNIVFADPQNNYHQLDAHTLRANLSHQFSDNIKGNLNAFYGDYDKVYANFYASDYDPVSNIVELDGYIDETVRDNFILSGNLIAELQTGDIEHTIIVGSEWIQTNSNQNRFNPVFSTTNSDKERFNVARPLDFNAFAGTNADGVAFTTGFSDLNDDTRVNLDVFSFYLQDEIAITEQFDIVLGARFDSFDIEVFNAMPTVLETRSRKDEEISPRAGLIFQPMENVSVYASYSESFLPRSGEQYANINGNNNQLDPDTYSNQEIGLKWDFDSGLSFTAALFENEQSSPQVADNDPETLDVIDSEISGVEMQLAGTISDDWHLSVNYSYLEGEIVDRNGPTGRTPRELPENTFSVWTNYQINAVLGVGLGATYQGQSYIDNGNKAILPSYTRFDAAAFYDVSNDLRVQLNIQNLTDKLYFPSAHSTHQASVGEPLHAKLSLIGRF